MTCIFLSYCRDDLDEVSRLRADLTSDEGVEIWWDQEIIPGQDWKYAIREAMKRSCAVLLCLSSRCLRRAQSGIYPEALDAIDAYRLRRPGEIFLIPVRLSECEIPSIEISAGRTLDSIHHVDLFPADRWHEGVQKILRAIKRAVPPTPPNSLTGDGQLGKSAFARFAEVHGSSLIDDDVRRKNLAKGDWRYDHLLPSLRATGWSRFAAGFKAGVYGHPQKAWCIKIMGMGVGDHPEYFAGRGYYVEHERRMLEAFSARGFNFQPGVKSVVESIAFLVEECGVSKDQAEWQSVSNHVLITERIHGVPFATQTGHLLNYEPDIAVFDSIVLREADRALHDLKIQLDAANRARLLHNDPMPANIVFSQGANGVITARLVDFELAQNLDEYSPDYVTNSVRELYDEREVPTNRYTGRHTKNLDQHIMEQALAALTKIRNWVKVIENGSPESDWVYASFSFLGGMSINVGDAVKYWRKRLKSTIQHRARMPAIRDSAAPVRQAVPAAASAIAPSS